MGGHQPLVAGGLGNALSSGLVSQIPSLLGGDCLAFIPRAYGEPRWKLMRWDQRAKGKEARVSSVFK